MKTKLHPKWVLALLCTVLFFYGFYLGGVQLVISEVSRCSATRFLRNSDRIIEKK